MPKAFLLILAALLLWFLRLAVRVLLRDEDLEYRTLMETASVFRQVGLVSSAAAFAIAFRGHVDGASRWDRAQSTGDLDFTRSLQQGFERARLAALQRVATQAAARHPFLLLS
jgi:hypothetical protein